MSSVAQKACVGSFAVRRPRMSRLISACGRFRDAPGILGGVVPASWSRSCCS